ncbi:ABC transporter ATP-binding protein/permease [Amphibiibacter pelophylacis]|uniref:ABC transporter ATP-binding protein/permease n=1 Tax=Amphibiibacter pelophylacis TaxID=1799477 RepID=A0ACC6P2U4_9BURK
MLLSDTLFGRFGDTVPREDVATPNRPPIRESLRQAWALARPYWTSNARRSGLLFMVLTVGLTLFGVAMSVGLNKWSNNFYTALQEKNAAEVWHQLLVFSGLAFASIIAAVYRQFFQQRLTLIWREWMTQQWLDDWLQGSAHWRIVTLKLRNDNPDQRITQDISSFVGDTFGLMLSLLNATVTLVSFVTLLWVLGGSLEFTLLGMNIVIPGFMVWAALIYALAGSWLTYRIGRPLVRLNFLQERLEANFRYSLARVREHGESIALQRGEKAEAAAAKSSFGEAVANTMRLILRGKKLTWMNSFYGQTAIIAPFFFAMPRYLAGAFTFGTLMQISRAFGSVQDALSWFVDAYASVASWQATVQRLHGLSQSIEAARAHQRPVVETPSQDPPGDGASAPLHTRLAISTPDSVPLEAIPADITIAPGELVLVEGPSGCGKSTWLRTLAGLWPHASGEIHWPDGERVFLPQKPYLPQGTLRAALAYPRTEADLDDDTARRLLNQVGLEALVDELDVADRWQDRLSLGEQQRLGFARLLHQQPRWLFLDEATSALDPAAETRLYTLLFEALPGASVVSIGHRPGLRELHGRVLRFAKQA